MKNEELKYQFATTKRAHLAPANQFATAPRAHLVPANQFVTAK